MSKRSILIVNDDGIESEGIRHLAQAAAAFGDVWVAAPAQQCSGMSQKISIFDEIPAESFDFPVPVRGAWRVGGTPADCVKLAMGCLLDQKPDFVFSGVNNGFNAGFDIAYSGTIGAAMEALMQGVPAIAFSNGFRGGFEIVDACLPGLIEELTGAPLPAGELWNVNFPGGASHTLRGILRGRTVAPTQLYVDAFDRVESADGAMRFKNTGAYASAEDAPEDSDVRAVLSGYISVGRVRCAVL